MWLTVLGFMVMGLVPRLSLASHSDSESFLVAHALLSQDGCQREGFWEVDGHTVSPFDLSRTLPVGGGLLVPYSLPGPPFVKQFIRMVTREPGQVGGISQCASPNRVATQQTKNKTVSLSNVYNFPYSSLAKVHFYMVLLPM